MVSGKRGIYLAAEHLLEFHFPFGVLLVIRKKTHQKRTDSCWSRRGGKHDYIGFHAPGKGAIWSADFDWKLHALHDFAG